MPEPTTTDEPRRRLERERSDSQSRDDQRSQSPAKGDPKPPAWRVEPAPDGRGAPPPTPPGYRSIGRRFLWFFLLLLGLNLLFAQLIPAGSDRVRIPYSPFLLQQIESGNVKAISSRGSTVQGEFKKATKYPSDDKDAKAKKLFSTEIPTFANTDEFSALLQKNDVEVNARPTEQGRGFLATLLLSFGPTLLLVALFIWLMRRAASQAGGGMMSFGRSRAKRVDQGEQQRIRFDDVAGIDEAEDELVEIVDFLKNPERYQKLGGKIPRGVLLSGRPGTGKTLLARAVAGEAGVPFFSMSASEFVEMVVGVGASRVRDLFEQAEKAAPAIIFIDELDAIGRARSGGASFSGGHDEREQTLNQILTEMDGFDGNTGVIVLAATNRPEILDQALLRPGRFDRRVVVQAPDTVGRRQILEIHTRSLPLADDVDLDALASSTPGMVGADLANLANEAALLAARRGHDKVRGEDFTDALEKVILGVERSVVMTDEDKRKIAVHEAGHAIVGMLTDGADPVRKVSIIPRGQALGVTLSSPISDRFNYPREYLLGKIDVALGGRVAEELVYGEVTTGAESDIQQVTGIARGMVGRWGMSDRIGFVAVLPSDADGPLLPGVQQTSEATQQLVDSEVRRIVDEAHARVTRLLGEHRERLDGLVAQLLERETLDELDAYAAAGVPPRAGVTPVA